MLQPATIIRRTKAGKLWLTWVMATRAGMISWGSERKRRNKSTRALSAALFALPNCKLCCPFPAEPGSSWDVPDEQDASCHCCAWCATLSPFLFPPRVARAWLLNPQPQPGANSPPGPPSLPFSSQISPKTTARRG